MATKVRIELIYDDVVRHGKTEEEAAARWGMGKDYARGVVRRGRIKRDPKGARTSPCSVCRTPIPVALDRLTCSAACEREVRRMVARDLVLDGKSMLPDFTTAQRSRYGKKGGAVVRSQWESMTDEQKDAYREKSRNDMANLSDEQRARMRAGGIKGGRRKQRTVTKTEQRRQGTEAWERYWAGLSEEEKEAFRERSRQSGRRAAGKRDVEKFRAAIAAKHVRLRCRACGEWFDAKFKTRKWCSPRCWRKGRSAA